MHVTSQLGAVQGGYGYTKGYSIEKYYREATVGKIYEGMSEYAAPDDRETDPRRRLRQRASKNTARSLL